MKKFLTVVLLMLFSGGVRANQEQDEAGLIVFVDTFFSQFSALSEKMWDKKKGQQNVAMMEMIKLTQRHFVRPTEESIRKTGDVASVRMIADLWPIAPKEWHVENVRVAGDVAKAKIHFVPSRGVKQEPIPYQVSFIRSGDRWLIMKAKNLHPKEAKKTEKEVELPADRTVEALVSPEKTLGEFLNYLADNRSAVDINNPASLRSSVKKITEALEKLWVKSPAANRAKNEAIAKLTMQDMKAWRIADSETANNNEWRAIVEVTLGERNPVSAYLKNKPTVIFDAEKSGNIWLLSGFSLQR